MPSIPDLIIFVHTGGRKYSGTNDSVKIVLYSDDGKASSPIKLNQFFSDNFENDQIDTFRVPPEDVQDFDRYSQIECVEVWKTYTLVSSDWFVDKIVVENSAANKSYTFPFYRWIKSKNHYKIKYLDTSLPQFDEFSEQRCGELEDKRKTYQFGNRMANGPAQVKQIPPDEVFSTSYKLDLAIQKIKLGIARRVTTWFHKKWENMDDIRKVYRTSAFEIPRSADTWNSDFEFGRHRVASMNPTLITQVTAIPEKFPVTDEVLGDLLEGLTLAEAIKQKRLFMTDLEILEGIPTKKGFTLCTPIALFFVNGKDEFLPVAIQLFQQPGEDNPIFTPNDPPLTWTFVKMWYNNADAQQHQSLTHLGCTHLLMEGVCVAMHRNISPSHPLFKVLSPHFMFLIAINWVGVSALMSPGGWVDKSLTTGAKGMGDLIIKGLDNWRMDVDGTFPENLKARGFTDPSVLPGYHYRDDALPLYNAILKYVKAYISLYYTSDEMLREDDELQAWVKELVMERSETGGGVGMKGVPGNGQITNSDDLAQILACVIFTCSVVHAGANFPQYDEYSFPPNYPSIMKGTPPTSKESVNITDQDIFNSLPNQETTLNVAYITTVLSTKGTNSLGDFEVQYIFDPKAMKVVEEFRADLKEIGKQIKARNSRMEVPYDYLDPEHVPNSISI